MVPSFAKLIFLGFATIVYVYLGKSFVQGSDLPVALQLFTLLWFLLLMSSVVAMPLYFWSARTRAPKPWHIRVIHFAHFSLLYLNYLLTLSLIRDLIAFFDSFRSAHLFHFYSPTMNICMIVAPFVLQFIGSIEIWRGPVRIDQKITSPKINTNLNGLKIVQISDLHISEHLRDNFVQHLIDVVEKAKPDLITLTGDILDGNPEAHADDLKFLGKLKAPLGVYYCPGNHEYYWDIDRSVQVMKSLGFEVLINDVKSITVNSTKMIIAGVADPTAKMFGRSGPDLSKHKQILKENEAYFRLLLCHQPKFADDFADDFDLQLSGHTHAGQFFPWNILIGLFQKYSKGLYQIKGLKLYVNQGTGYWGPKNRLGTSCEVTVLELLNT